MVIPAGEQAHIVNHGEARGEELDGASHQVVARVAVERGEVGAIVLVGVAYVAAALALVEVLHVGVAAQAVLHHLLQLLHIAHLAPTSKSQSKTESVTPKPFAARYQHLSSSHAPSLQLQPLQISP